MPIAAPGAEELVQPVVSRMGTACPRHQGQIRTRAVFGSLVFSINHQLRGLPAEVHHPAQNGQAVLAAQLTNHPKRAPKHGARLGWFWSEALFESKTPRPQANRGGEELGVDCVHREAAIKYFNCYIDI